MIIRNRKDQNGRTTYDGSVAFNTSPNTNTTELRAGRRRSPAISPPTAEAASDPVGFFRFTQYEAYVEDAGASAAT